MSDADLLRALDRQQIVVTQPAVESLGVSLAVYDEALAAADTPQAAWLFEKTTRLMMLICAKMSVEARGQWQMVLTEELADLPFFLVSKHMVDMIRQVKFDNEPLVWMYARIEPEMQKLNSERRTIVKALEIVAKLPAPESAAA